MRKQEFKDFLLSEITIGSQKSVSRRLSYAKDVEEILGITLDDAVSNDDTMYESLLKLIPFEYSSKNAHFQNILRKYYKFCNGKEFPRINSYHSVKHP